MMQRINDRPIERPVRCESCGCTIYVPDTGPGSGWVCGGCDEARPPFDDDSGGPGTFAGEGLS